jgi:hypothetical protein
MTTGRRTGRMERINRIVGATMLDREDPTALGLMRIVLVAIFTLALVTHVGAVAEYFSDASVLAGPYARQAFHSRWSLFFYITDPWAVRAIFALGVVAHLLWLVGLFTPVAAVVSWLLWASMMGRHPLLYSLADQLLMVLVTLVALMPTGRGLSLDARWRGKGGTVPVWCRRMMQLQLAVVYVGTGALKTGDTWRVDGTALYYTLSNPYNRHFDVQQALGFLQPWVLRPMTWLVLCWEVGFGGFVAVHWIRELLGRPRRLPDLRKPFLGFGIAMHVGIQAMLYVAWFSPLAIAAYTAFLSPAEASRLVARVRRR